MSDKEESSAKAPPEPNVAELNASVAATASSATAAAVAPTPTTPSDVAVAANSHRVKELRLHFPSGEQLVEIEETGPHDDDEVYQRLIDAASASSLAQSQRVKRFLLPLTAKQISILPNGAIIVPEFDSTIAPPPTTPTPSSVSSRGTGGTGTPSASASGGGGGGGDSSFYSPIASSVSAETLAEVNAGLPSDIKLAVAKAEEIDTKVIATRVQELLASHHISQAAFSENIVKLTQGALSNLLNKPKPWATLHNSGRQPYLRMKLWLDEEGFEKRLAALIKLQHERRGQRKRPLPGLGDGAVLSTARRVRHVLTDEQKTGLQELFMQNNRPSKEELTSRATELGLPFSTVSNWFHNQRAKANRMKMETSLSEQEPPANEEEEHGGSAGEEKAEAEKTAEKTPEKTPEKAAAAPEVKPEESSAV